MTSSPAPSWPTKIHQAADATARIALRTDDPGLLRRAAAMLDAIANGVDGAEDSIPTEFDIAAKAAKDRGLRLTEVDGTYTLTDVSAFRILVGPDDNLDGVLGYLDLDEFNPGQ